MESTPAYLFRLAGEATALYFRAAPGYEARLTQDASLVLTGEPFADLNIAIIDDSARAEERLREFTDVIRQKQLPCVMLFSEPVADRLAPTAAPLGLQSPGRVPLMVLRSPRLPAASSPYRAERVQDAAALAAANDVWARAFGIPVEAVNRAVNLMSLDGPGVEVFLASRDGIPMSAVTTTRAGDIVGIWGMATPPEHQRQGGGRAVLTHAIASHRERGAGLYFLGATQQGKPLYDRLGFQTIAKAAVWVAGHAAQFPGA